MNYFVLRDGQQYGPYTLADLQRYIASGNISLNDMARSEAMQEWVPVSQITGNINVGAQSSAAQSFGQVPAYATTGQPVAGEVPQLVPDLHWGLVLLFGLISCGLFLQVWMFFQAVAARRLDPRSNALLLYIIGMALAYGGSGVSVTIGPHHSSSVSGLLDLAGIIVIIVGHFNLRSTLEEHFNRVERIGLRLSGVMTFFFNTVYFQYHMNAIQRWRRTGVLS
jgi:hypothetical protein